MMGTLAASLAGKKIRTSEDLYHADVQGDIENVNGILKITTMIIRQMENRSSLMRSKETRREAP
ncbi:MAG: hypothetical protein ACP5SH_20560 [Syntrophobacteraceae bacterium]